ncbi:hypothetical protein Slala03_26860 [Streptomyces lavendulae subsp. lavendulae]|uniref:hypothetical protein n=1 Tax=Streptomyces lavendulae TaxID=1914 RepID=UPI0024A05642|nr:hypothetical protein [Streptomyces lavendulae]GLV82997.1 hypothetical protein Slala03_26860 [Streptomyces lavendulae subsp. lavendulae]GLX34511.1 hypothetical protein Sros01_05840 [Streptomyces roseochromogenus]
MTRVTGTTPEGERPVERLLREALTARAQEVTVVTLRPADPPGPHLRRLSLRTPWVRRSAWTLAGLSGLAAAALAGFLVLGGPDPVRPRPVQPASPPEFTSPAPSGSPRPSAPPSASVSPPPSPAPSRTPTSGPPPGASPSRAPRTPPPTVPAGGQPSAGAGSGVVSATPSPPHPAGAPTPHPSGAGN